MERARQRPRFLDLWKIRMPATAWTSILHRASGVLMFLSIPFMAWLLQLSLRGDGLPAALASPLVRVALTMLAWALLHHLLAGLRFLCIDLEWGMDRAAASFSARLVSGLALLLALALAWRWW